MLLCSMVDDTRRGSTIIIDIKHQGNERSLIGYNLLAVWRIIMNSKILRRWARAMCEEIEENKEGIKPEVYLSYPFFYPFASLHVGITISLSAYPHCCISTTSCNLCILWIHSHGTNSIYMSPQLPSQ